MVRRIIDSAIQDSAPGNICAGLQHLGVNAKVAARGRQEENIGTAKIGALKVGGGDSLGIIDIAEGPIRWINIRRIYVKTGTAGGTYNYFTDYGVPAHKPGTDWHGKQIKSIRVKKFPLFGKVVDLRWKGGNSSQEIIHRLNNDTSIKEPIMRSRDLLIKAYPENGCWILSTANPRKEAPSREVWDCYQKIARYLTE